MINKLIKFYYSKELNEIASIVNKIAQDIKRIQYSEKKEDTVAIYLNTGKCNGVLIALRTLKLI